MLDNLKDNIACVCLGLVAFICAILAAALFVINLIQEEDNDMLIYILKLLAGPILVCAAGTGGLL